MFQDEVLVEALLVHLVDFGSIHKVNNLADAIDRLAVVDPYAVSHPSPCSWCVCHNAIRVRGLESVPLQKSANQGAA